jgi:hypothetical protein
MVALLRPKIRTQIEQAVKQGIPVMAAGAMFGFSPKSVNNWLQLGSSLDKPPAPPKDKELAIELSDGDFVPGGQWHAHQLECMKLAASVAQHEGVLIGKLTTAMWKRAIGRQKIKDPDMMKFLFKHYGHVHGLVERKGTDKQAEAKDPTEHEADIVQFYIPDNGRGPSDN